MWVRLVTWDGFVRGQGCGVRDGVVGCGGQVCIVGLNVGRAEVSISIVVDSLIFKMITEQMNT